MNEDKRRLVFNTLEDLSPDREVLVHNYIKQLETNWNELKSWLEEMLKEYQKSKYPGEYGLVLGFIWEMQRKIQELEQVK